MTWHDRITTLIVIGLFLAGYGLGYWGRWDERIKDRRSRRLVERLGRERGGW